jgi:hypothetical protein
MSPTNYKIIGQTADSLQGVETLHYKTPTSGSALIRGLNITNTSFQDDQYTISINPKSIFIATPTGQNGNRCMYSFDGINWIQSSTLLTYPYNNFGNIYLDDTFLQFSGLNQVSKSTDGINWSYVSTAFSGAAGNMVAYGNKKILFVNSYGGAAYSINNGTTWTVANLPNVYGTRSAYYVNVIYANNKFIAWTDEYTPVIYTSTDAITWTQQTSFTTTPPYNLGAGRGLYAYGAPQPDIVYGKGVYVGMGRVGIHNSAFYSTDGINWSTTTLPSTAQWGAVVYGNGMFVALGYGVAAYSYDGTIWQAGSPVGLYSYFGDIAYGNGVFVGTGNNDVTCYSTDGINWSYGNGINFNNSSYLSWCVNFSTTSNSNYILYNNTIPAFTTISLKCGYALQSSSSPASIQVTSKKGITTFTSFGAEIT